MFRKRKLLIISVTLLSFFILTTRYLLATLTEIEIPIILSVQEKIFKELENLPENYKNIEPVQEKSVNTFIENIKSVGESPNLEILWKTAKSWVTKNGIVDFQSAHLGHVLLALEKTKIIKADLDTRGTQLKLLLTLEGNQTVIFKPKWYDIDKIIEGPVYAGKDRYSSEIVAFYMSGLLNLPFTPLSTQRAISLNKEIIPKGTKRLLNTSFRNKNRTCIYGSCFYCKPEDPICTNNGALSGAVIFNILGPFKSYRSPWQRTYKKSKKAAWEESPNYCNVVKEKLTKRRLLDLVDTAVFDFLIQNGDRHHYETLHDNVILLDNGKGFGNPNIQHIDILAPLYQCCTLRGSTLKRLQNLAGGNLKKMLELTPKIDDIISTAHLEAMEKRLLIIFATVEYCRHRDKSV